MFSLAARCATAAPSAAASAARRLLPVLCARALSTVEGLRRTALYDEHVELGGKMVEFAGYALPVSYRQSHVESHLWVRERAGLFDVSHMGQLRFTGPDREAFVESVTVADFQTLAEHQATLSLIPNERGGLFDDCIVTRRRDEVRIVVNGACKEADMAHFRQSMKTGKHKVEMEYKNEHSLIALQGPRAADVLRGHLPSSIDFSQWGFMTDVDTQFDGSIDVTVGRCGYTGEDGFEIAVHQDDAVDVWRALLQHEEDVQPAGLGVRDSLRLEAGLCLYGHDLDETTSPVEATLLWTISKRRRAEGGFTGADVIQKHIAEGVARKRVGLTVLKGAPARDGAEILDMEGNPIGVVTSGSFSPVLKQPISMGYVKTGMHKKNTPVQVVVRGKAQDAVVTKMPFVPSHYFQPEKKQ